MKWRFDFWFAFKCILNLTEHRSEWGNKIIARGKYLAMEIVPSSKRIISSNIAVFFGSHCDYFYSVYMVYFGVFWAHGQSIKLADGCCDSS